MSLKRKLSDTELESIQQKRSLPSPLIQPVIYYYPQPSAADEREKARKVSHSAIEKRRRERINEKIVQLKELIPSCADQDNLHKMTVLQSAIDYISYLKEIVKGLDESVLEGGKRLKLKSTKSMLPKEVEPFTTQFSAKQVIPLTPPQEPTISTNEHMSLHNILC
ncbi:hypothetical protein G6F56_010175 [Rhizopus delemar]|nr:hypothetical protein G6F56_010175 [Rhizopus delemar]